MGVQNLRTHPNLVVLSQDKIYLNLVFQEHHLARLYLLHVAHLDQQLLAEYDQTSPEEFSTKKLTNIVLGVIRREIGVH